MPLCVVTYVVSYLLSISGLKRRVFLPAIVVSVDNDGVKKIKTLSEGVDVIGIDEAQFWDHDSIPPILMASPNTSLPFITLCVNVASSPHLAHTAVRE